VPATRLGIFSHPRIVGVVGPRSHRESIERDFGDFRIVREIGRGGMEIVYEARQVAIERRVALKALPLAAAMDPRALQRFQLEAHVAGFCSISTSRRSMRSAWSGRCRSTRCSSSRGGSLADLIVELRGLGDHGAVHGANPSANIGSDLALSLLLGKLAVREARTDHDNHGEATTPTADEPGSSAPRSIRGRSYVRTVVQLGIQAAQALGYAHERRVIHRDVKPANVLLDRRGDLWVADFGMADVQGDAGLTLTGNLPGTLRYMSLEQNIGKRALVDRRTGIYSLGATLYKMLSLQPAVAGTDRQEIIHRIAEIEPEPLRRLNPTVPIDLATIVSKALSKEPRNRYNTARQLAGDLGRFLDRRPTLARPIGPISRSWRWCRREPVYEPQHARHPSLDRPRPPRRRRSSPRFVGAVPRLHPAHDRHSP
jgi:eukaryotic-like serine/threonine-protein kinase